MGWLVEILKRLFAHESQLSSGEKRAGRVGKRFALLDNDAHASALSTCMFFLQTVSLPGRRWAKIQQRAPVGSSDLLHSGACNA